MSSKDEKIYRLNSDILDVLALREDFPIFRHSPHCYLDNASTTHKPIAVLTAMQDFYEKSYANVHRGVYDLSAEASSMLDQARMRVASYLGASQAEVIFTYGTTDGINAVARGLDASFFPKGSNICICASEHHANLIPWQEAAKRLGVDLRILPLDEELKVDVALAQQHVSQETALVAVAHTSNVTGVRHPIKQLTELAHQHNALVLLDAAQGMLCRPQVSALDVDFLTFSGHKIFGPMGIGVLYGKHHLLQQMHPFRFGGDMVQRVTFDEASWGKIPRKFEGGTLPVAQAIGLAEALTYVDGYGAGVMHDQACLVASQARTLLLKGGWKLLGNDEPTSILSFYHDEIHPHDIASILADHNVCIRAGHHCAQPFLRSRGLSATARLSFSAYNKLSDLDLVDTALHETKRIFS